MKKINKILCTVVFAIAMLLLTTKVEAATATISASSSTANVGDSVNIIVKYTAASWDLTASGTGISTTKYVDVTDDAENATSTKTIKLDTSTAGTKEIKLTGTVSDGTTGQTTKINTSVKVTINEKPATNNGGGNTTSQPTKGTVTSCEVDGIKIKESRNVTNKESVSVKVVTSTGEGLTIYNNKTKKSYSAKSGQVVNVQIMEGTNTLTITLKSGATATRKVYSKKQEEVKPNVEEPSISEPQETTQPEEVVVGLQSLVIKGITIDDDRITLPFTPTFASDVYEYQMLLDDSFSEDFVKLDVEAIALQTDFEVEVTGLEEELEEGKNIITITVKSADGEKTVTYKITVTKEATVMPISAPVEEEPQEEIKPIWNETQQIIIVVFTSVVAFMGIIYAIVEYRYSKKKGQDKEESKIPYSGLDFENDVNEEETEKKKRKSKKQQKLEEEEAAEHFFEKMATPKEEKVNSIIDDSKQEKIDNINPIDDKKDLDDIFGINNMNSMYNTEDTPQKPKKRGKHF